MKLLDRTLPEKDGRRKFVAIALTVLLAGLLTTWGIYVMGQYGIALFILTPLLKPNTRPLIIGLKDDTEMTKRIISMVLIATAVNLFGCSGQTNNDNKNLSKKMEEQMESSLEAFKNRPVHKELTEQTIDTTSDDNLLQVVFDNLSEKQPADYEKEYETVMSWNRSRQAIYIIWALEGEVNNGGYNQFYANSNGQFYKHLPDALKLVGANKFADLTERANKTFEKEYKKITKYQDGTIEGFSKSYNDNPLTKFDDEFYELYKTEDLRQIQVNYIRKNKKEFIDK